MFYRFIGNYTVLGWVKRANLKLRCWKQCPEAASAVVQVSSHFYYGKLVR